MNTPQDTDELEEFRQAIGRILDKHGNEAINAWREQKGFDIVKWDKGTYVLELEKLFTSQLQAYKQRLLSKMPEKIEKPKLNTETVSYMKAIELQNSTIDEVTKIIEES